MLFVELRFLPFFLLVFGVHWLLPRNHWRKHWLLLCSYLFYAAWDWRFLSLILSSTVVDYVVGLRVARPGGRRKAWILVSLLFNLGLLGVFKYLDFFLGSAAALLTWLGFQPHLPTLQIILPVGISFYTFQTLSYSLDVYFGRLPPVRRFLDLALFVAFFPQLVAGPIVRAVDFLPQLDSRRVFARVDVRGALMLFLVGFFKKACVSDALAPVVDDYFAAPANFDVWAAWIAILFYSIQIYCDFSGYSDMAIACAALLGYRLCLNFYFPYFANNIADFWRRWHISLYSWLRDYVYIPLGGNRCGPLAMYRNLMVTLVLCGLWHGAAWNFVIFGFLQSAAYILRLHWRRHVDPGAAVQRALRWLGVPLTYYFFVGSLIVFRGVDAGRSWTAIRSYVLLESPGTETFHRAGLLAFAVLAVMHAVSYRRWFGSWWRRIHDLGFAACYAVLVALALSLVSTGTRPFLYFQF